MPKGSMASLIVPLEKKIQPYTPNPPIPGLQPRKANAHMKLDKQRTRAILKIARRPAHTIHE